MCDHNTTVDDVHTGDIICEDCGWIVGPQMVNLPSDTYSSTIQTTSLSSSSPPPAKRKKLHKLHNPWNKLSPGAMFIIREQLMDVCAALHIDAVCTIDTALHILRTICPDETALVKGKARAEAAYAVWESMNRQGIPRSPLAIADLFGVSHKAILKVANEFDATYCTTSSYADSVCAILYLPYCVGCVVRDLLVRVESRLYGRTPHALLAAAILSVVKKIRELEKDSGKFENITMSELVAYFNVDQRSITNAIRKFPDPSSYSIEHSLSATGNCQVYKLVFKK